VVVVVVLLLLQVRALLQQPEQPRAFSLASIFLSGGNSGTRKNRLFSFWQDQKGSTSQRKFRESGDPLHF
jgi:hypothetical protein